MVRKHLYEGQLTMHQMVGKLKYLQASTYEESKTGTVNVSCLQRRRTMVCNLNCFPSKSGSETWLSKDCVIFGTTLPLSGFFFCLGIAMINL